MITDYVSVYYSPDRS